MKHCFLRDFQTARPSTVIRHITIAVFLVLATLLASRPALAAGPILNDASRSSLPAVIRGGELSPFIGKSNESLRIYANWGSGLQPIPFQIDEKNPKGLFVLDGIPANPPDEDPGKLDNNDELVFMLEDAGLKTHQGLWPKGYDTAREVELTDAIDGRKGYIYLFSFASPPPKSQIVHIRYDSGKDEVESAYIRFGFLKSHPFIFNNARISEYEGGKLGSGKAVNLLDRLKVRLTARAVGELVTLRFTEEDFKGQLIGVRVGPVRVIRYLTASVKVGPMPEIPIEIEYRITPRTLQVPVSFTAPGAITTFLTDMDMIIGVDFRDMRGSTFSTLAMSRGTLVDGKLSPAERAIPLGDEEWVMLGGHNLNIFGVIDLEKDLALRKEVHFLDDPDTTLPPEAVPGQLPEIGFRFLNWTSLQGRKYSFDATVSALAGFPRGGGSGFYKAIHNPPKVQLGTGNAAKVALVHAANVSPSTLGAIEGALTQASKGALQGLSIEKMPIAGSARTADLDKIAQKGADLVILLADADPGEVRDRIERRGTPVIMASAGGGDALSVPADRVVSMLRQSVTEGGKIFFLSGAAESAKLWSSYEDAAKRDNVNLVNKPVDAGKSAAQVIQEADAAKAEAVLILPDSYWAGGGYKNLKAAADASEKLKKPIPIFVTGKEAVAQGGLLGLELAQGVSPTAIATQAVSVLQGNAASAVQSSGGGSGTTEFYINVEALRKGRFRLPLQILKVANRIGS